MTNTVGRTELLTWLKSFLAQIPAGEVRPVKHGLITAQRAVSYQQSGLSLVPLHFLCLKPINRRRGEFGHLVFSTLVFSEPPGMVWHTRQSTICVYMQRKAMGTVPISTGYALFSVQILFAFVPCVYSFLFHRVPRVSYHPCSFACKTRAPAHARWRRSVSLYWLLLVQCNRPACVRELVISRRQLCASSSQRWRRS